MQSLNSSLTREHAQRIRAWILQREVMSVRCGIGHADTRFCIRCIEGADPPAIVRAMWIMLFEHMTQGVPVALPPSIAQVYIDHADTVPGAPCPGCSYLLPARGGRLAFTGACPVCCHAVEGRQ